MTTATLLVLCGLPAAGKTTFAKAFVDFLQLRCEHQKALSVNHAAAETVIRDYWVAHLAYDDMLPVVYSTQPFQVHSMEWKLHRRKIKTCLDQLLSRLLTTATANNDSGTTDEVSVVFDKLTKHLNTRHPVILLLDDNMYYASMRYEIYQLARKYSTGYAQLYFPAKLSQAIDNNRLRGCPVPDDVISSMAERIDIPTAGNSWERRTMVWSEEDHSNQNFHKVMELVEGAFENPVSPRVDDLSIHESRVICSTNIIHQCDCIIRQLITENVSSVKAELSDSNELRSHAKRLNEARQTILNDMRLHRLLAPPSVVESTANSKCLYEFVTDVFEEYVSKDC